MKNKMRNINGPLLYKGISSGIKNLLEYQDKLDEINVFPVPDGDTGTNMCFTLLPVLEEYNNKSNRADTTLNIIADLALDSARGNSGTIIAQWFHGMRRACEDKENLNISDFSKAFKRGYESAKDSLLNPQEGTIITTMRALAEKSEDLVKENCDNYSLFLKECYTATEIALQETKKILKILKKTDVVDAGALGFVLIFQGVLHITQRSSKIQTTHLDITYKTEKIEALKKDIDFTIHNKYCTECIVRANEIDRKGLKEEIKNFGDSLVFAGTKTRVKIHIHTNEPADFFNKCEKYGQVSDRKADDMTIQEHTKHHGDDGTDVAIVADSGADIPEEYYKDINIVPLRYSFGVQQHLDKVTQDIRAFYQQMESDKNHPKTSQATPRDFNKTYNFVSSHHDSIISIHISKQVSGTYNSALNASKSIKNKKIYILDSCNVSVGQGLIAMYAVDLKSQGKSYNEIIQGLELIKKNTKVFAAFRDLKYVVKGGRISPSIKKIANLFNIRPILTANNIGKLKLGGILFGQKDMIGKLAKLVNRKINNNSYYRIIVSHANCKEKGQTLLNNISSSNTNIISSYLVKLGGALGVHAGPGSLVVGIQKMKEDAL